MNLYLFTYTYTNTYKAVILDVIFGGFHANSSFGKG